MTIKQHLWLWIIILALSSFNLSSSLFWGYHLWAVGNIFCIIHSIFSINHWFKEAEKE